MSDPSYITGVYRTDGGNTMVVGPGGKLVIDGGILENATAQAALIAAPTGGTTTDTQARAAIVSIIAALEAVGIVASS